MVRLSSFASRFISALMLLLVGPTSHVCFADPTAETHSLVRKVGCIGMTVSDLNRSIDFYARLRTFQKVWEVELAGDPYEQLAAVFGLRARIARLQLGSECVCPRDVWDFRAPFSPAIRMVT